MWVGRLFTHELGHVLGFNHTTGQCSLMYPIYDFGLCPPLPLEDPGYYNCRWIDKKLLKRFTPDVRRSSQASVEAVPDRAAAARAARRDVQRREHREQAGEDHLGATGLGAGRDQGPRHGLAGHLVQRGAGHLGAQGRCGPQVRHLVRSRLRERHLVLPRADREPLRRDPAAYGQGARPVRARAGRALPRHPDLAAGGHQLAPRLDPAGRLHHAPGDARRGRPRPPAPRHTTRRRPTGSTGSPAACGCCRRTTRPSASASSP